MTSMRRASRFAFVSGMAGASWGGSEVLWSRAAKKLAQQNHHVYASVHHWPNPVPAIEELKRTGISVHARRAGVSSLPIRILSKVRRLLGKSIRHVSGFDQNFKDLLSFSPDVVCISHGAFACGLSWMEWCRDKSIPYVSIVQCNFEGWWPSDELAARLRSAYQSAAVAAFVSQRNQELFESQVGGELRNARVVRNPVQVDSLEPVPWQNSTSTRLACVGRLEVAAKGQDLILQVLSLPKWRDRDLYVSFYGDGPNRDTLVRLARRLGIDDKVSFEGHVSDVREIWSSNHALVLPSRYEGLPLAVVEAMMCGRIAIVTDIAGNAEVVQDGATGYLAEAPTMRHLDATLERAWLEREKWQVMGSLAREEIKPRYEKPAEDELVDMLCKVASRSCLS